MANGLGIEVMSSEVNKMAFTTPREMKSTRIVCINHEVI